MNETLVRKLTSRKFIIALITLIAGIITMIVGDSEVVTTIAGAAMTIVPTAVYCIMEGVVDAKSVETITEATKDAAEQLGAGDDIVDLIGQMGTMGGILIEGDTEDESDKGEDVNG